MKKMRSRLKNNSISPHIDMTPMVDVMMLLLIFFMMSTTFIITHPGFAVNLPRAAAAQEQPPQNITILVDQNGQIAIGDKILSLGELSNLLRAAAANQPVVYIKADKEVKHGRVVEIMDEAHQAGISKVSIAIETKGK